MTNQQGAPEALRLAEEITELMCSNEAAARTIAAAADELCRLHYENKRLAAMVEAQQPAPSAAVVFDAHGYRDWVYRNLPDETLVGNGAWWADHLTAWAKRFMTAAPQQEVQEPAAYIHVPHHTVEGKVRPVVSFEKYQQDYADGIYSTRIPLYTAPQPAPAPLSDDVVKDAARYRWLAEHPNEWRLYRKHGNHKMPFRMMRDGDPWGQSFTSADEAIDAAMNKGGA